MSDEYRRGPRAALDRVLQLINTIEERHIDRSKLYSMILELRPVDDYLPLLCVSCRTRDS